MVMLYLVLYLGLPIFLQAQIMPSDNDNSSTIEAQQVPLAMNHQIGILHTMANLTYWAAREENISDILKERLRMLKSEVRLIEKYLTDYKETTKAAYDNLLEPRNTPDERGHVVESSAVLAHRMTNRYTSIISELRKLLQSPVYSDSQHNLNHVLDLIKNELKDEHELRQWPDRMDKFMSTNAFHHFQMVLGIKASQLMYGLPFDTSQPGNFTALQCTELGIFCLGRKVFDFALEWLQVATQLTSSNISGPKHLLDTSISNELVTAFLVLTVQEHNRRHVNFSNESMRGLFMTTFKEGEIAESKPTRNQDLQYYFSGLGPDSHPFAQFYEICIGITLQTPKMQMSLKCYYERKRHPYLYINPVKTETLSESPPVFQYYEVLSNTTSEKIKNGVLHKLQLSEVVGSNDLGYIISFRTSVGTYLKYSDAPEFYEMSKIVSGLNVLSKNDGAQVVEYVYGRYYDYHTDALEGESETLPSVLEEGDRLATMLFYVDLPKAGGLTPFCQAGVSAHPVPGSAVLWFSMYRNGTVRQDVAHGACPVIHGHKLIINHWIRYGSNFNSHKCSLNQWE